MNIELILKIIIFIFIKNAMEENTFRFVTIMRIRQSNRGQCPLFCHFIIHIKEVSIHYGKIFTITISDFTMLVLIIAKNFYQNKLIPTLRNCTFMFSIYLSLLIIFVNVLGLISGNNEAGQLFDFLYFILAR